MAELPHEGGMGFRAAVGEVIQERASGSAGIIHPQCFQNCAFKSFHETKVWLFFP